MSFRRSRIPRRKFVKLAGGASASATLAACGSAEGTPDPMDPTDPMEPMDPTDPGNNLTATTIDTHHHMVPDFYVQRLADAGIVTAGGIPFPEWTLESSIETMDNNGIDHAVLSLSSPGVFFGDQAFATQLSRDVNEFGASIMADNSRFGFCANVPQPGGEESAAEAVYALDELGADGVALLASAGDRFLGDPVYDELLAELDARNAVVFLHPNQHSSSQPENLGLDTPVFAVEFVVDTTRAVQNMIWQGTFERFPNIRWIVAHAGGTIPYLVYRLPLVEIAFPDLRERSPEGTLTYLKRLYYDTALSMSRTALFALLDLVGPDQITFGSDFPFAPGLLVSRQTNEFDGLAEDTGFPAVDASTVETIRGNGYTLFPRLG
ncbi:MAG: amidohydrolase family protein [Myxococcota bacterium]